MHESEFILPGFCLFSININIDSHRGIIIYIDSALDASQMELTVKFNECLCVQIKYSNSCILTIGAVYRSPSSSVENDRLLCELIKILSNQVSGRLVLVGDFNFRSINWKNWSVEGTTSKTNTAAHTFLNCLRDNYLIQHTMDPTRARGTQTPSLLDLVITNEDFVDYVHNLSPLGKSDHSVLQFCCNIPVIDSCNMSKLNYNKGNYSGLREHLANKIPSCNSPTYSVADAWIGIKEVLECGTKKFIPAVSNNNWKRKGSWRHPISKDVQQLIKRKHRIWTRYQETRNVTVFNEFKQIRNLVRKESRKIAQKVQSDIAQCCRHNPKKFWQYINSKTSSKCGIGDIVAQVGNSRMTLTTDLKKEDLEKANEAI